MNSCLLDKKRSHGIRIKIEPNDVRLQGKKDSRIERNSASRFFMVELTHPGQVFKLTWEFALS